MMAISAARIAFTRHLMGVHNCTMRRQRLPALRFYLPTVLLLAGAHNARALTEYIELEQGRIRGRCDDAIGVCQYLGLPFAAPPVGDNRWATTSPAPGVGKCHPRCHRVPLPVPASGPRQSVGPILSLGRGR